jgi:hypothetical protein
LNNIYTNIEVKDVDIEALRCWIPISKFETLITTFLRYQRIFGNFNIEADDVTIEGTEFDIEETFDIKDFDIEETFNFGLAMFQMDYLDTVLPYPEDRAKQYMVQTCVYHVHTNTFNHERECT